MFVPHLFCIDETPRVTACTKIAFLRCEPTLRASYPILFFGVFHNATHEGVPTVIHAAFPMPPRPQIMAWHPRHVSASARAQIIVALLFLHVLAPARTSTIFYGAAAVRFHTAHLLRPTPLHTTYAHRSEQHALRLATPLATRTLQHDGSARDPRHGLEAVITCATQRDIHILDTVPDSPRTTSPIYGEQLLLQLCFIDTFPCLSGVVAIEMSLGELKKEYKARVVTLGATGAGLAPDQVIVGSTLEGLIASGRDLGLAKANSKKSSAGATPKPKPKGTVVDLMQDLRETEATHLSRKRELQHKEEMGCIEVKRRKYDLKLLQAQNESIRLNKCALTSSSPRRRTRVLNLTSTSPSWAGRMSQQQHLLNDTCPSFGGVHSISSSPGSHSSSPSLTYDSTQTALHLRRGLILLSTRAGSRHQPVWRGPKGRKIMLPDRG
ncbi:hypothetical protein B0H19DRAFT_1378665 [Mycena capillaripes]|nr:hypothetical protein B0H19DRAFT_1378665 [Mycena capillaripes]